MENYVIAYSFQTYDFLKIQKRNYEECAGHSFFHAIAINRAWSLLALKKDLQAPYKDHSSRKGIYYFSSEDLEYSTISTV